MATTTSTENSGLLDVLLPQFTKETGTSVKVLAKGTGAALRDGMDGNVDVVFVHAREREEEFLSQGYGAYRLSVMHNDFVIVGPRNDPAGIAGSRDAGRGLEEDCRKKDPLCLQGRRQRDPHTGAGVVEGHGNAPQDRKFEVQKSGQKQALSLQYPDGLGQGYLSIGQGMGKTLTYAEERQAYTLADRGTYLKYKHGRKQGLDLEILCQGDPRLFNPYGIIPVNPKKHPHVKFKEADGFAKWLVSPKAQSLIASYRIEGHQVFFPDAVAK